MANVFAGFSVDTNFCKVKSMMNDMSDSIILVFEGQAVRIFSEVATQLGLRHGQHIDQHTFARVGKLSCEILLATYDLDSAIDEFNQVEEPKSI